MYFRLIGRFNLVKKLKRTAVVEIFFNVNNEIKTIPFCLFQVKSDVETLVDKYFGGLYENYEYSRKCLVRQARDLLVCEYHGCLQRFESEFCIQAEKLLQHLKVSACKIMLEILRCSYMQMFGWSTYFERAK